MLRLAGKASIRRRPVNSALGGMRRRSRNLPHSFEQAAASPPSRAIRTVQAIRPLRAHRVRSVRGVPKCHNAAQATPKQEVSYGQASVPGLWRVRQQQRKLGQVGPVYTGSSARCIGHGIATSVPTMPHGVHAVARWPTWFLAWVAADCSPCRHPPRDSGSRAWVVRPHEVPGARNAA